MTGSGVDTGVEVGVTVTVGSGSGFVVSLPVLIMELIII
jgi:hypothetical protein